MIDLHTNHLTVSHHGSPCFPASCNISIQDLLLLHMRQMQYPGYAILAQLQNWIKVCYHNLKIQAMSLQNLTIKSQEILQQAQQLAFTAGNSSIETEHILKAMLEDRDS